jgi:hypothetical protein
VIHTANDRISQDSSRLIFGLRVSGWVWGGQTARRLGD